MSRPTPDPPPPGARPGVPPYEASIETPPPRALLALHARSARARAAAEAALGLALPDTATVATAQRRLAFRIGPSEWRIAAPLADEAALFERLDRAVGGDGGAVVVVSDAHVVLRLAGPGALDVLAQAVAIDLDPGAFPPGTAVRCGFGRIRALVHRLDDTPTFDLHVERPLERYARRLLEVARGGEGV